MKVRTRSIIRFVSSALRSPSGRARKRSSSSCSFFQASCRPCSKRRSPAPGSKFLMLPRIKGTCERGRSLQRGRVMSISPTQRMPYLSSQVSMASRASRPPTELGQLVQDFLVLDVLQKRHHVRMRADHVGDAQRRQPISDVTLWGTDCVSVSAAFFSPSHASSCSLSHRSLHRRHEHLMALRIEQDPLQLLDVRPDEVEQRRSGLRPDVALQCGDGGLAAPDQLGDDGRIGLDWGRRAAKRWPGGPSSGSGRMKPSRSRMVCSASRSADRISP